ncbi:armadillo repeat-containing protein 2 isoform X2 [Genypterus blacodes]|uniref:armadillo repeat-containing protein 2 isoform X2 n=1 Tax=Genypterus blacodes TaxID=154954 RepID=UPI003F77395D
MASKERKRDIASPLVPRRNTLRKTSAEIVNEARQSLRTVSTQRPFTPRDGVRQLFGKSSVHADRDGRPSSTFSVHAKNFDAPESRPGSGTRLSPLEHKPKFPVPCNAEDLFKACPKPPTDPLEAKRGLTGARARLLRAGSLSTLPPANPHKDEKETLCPDSGQKQLSAGGRDKGAPVRDRGEVPGGPRKPGPRRTASESRIKTPDVDSGVEAAEDRVGHKTEVGSDKREEGAKSSSVCNNEIVPLLQELESMAAGRPEGSVDRLCDLCARLHGVLAEADVLGRRCKRRSGILRTLFRLIDLNSDQLNLHIAELCLALCVSGNNLLNICKLIFKISQSENNDIFFENNSIIDSLLAVLSGEGVSACGEALLYCVGTLKFLSGNGSLLKLLLDKNCVGVSQQLIQRLHTLSAQGDTHFTTAGHILVQLTATLRNLADHADSRPLFISCGVLSELCTVLRLHSNDLDVCVNVSRIYSKLSSYSECRLALDQTPGCYKLFIELLSKHHRKKDLVVRLLFTLGNLTSKSDEARALLFRCEGCVDTLLLLYDSYQRRDASHAAHTLAEDDSPTPGKPHVSPGSVRGDEDVLVKLVRVLANVCVHPAVGPALASNTACTQLLMETLELRSVQESEELLVNVAVTINNLSFYQEETSAVTLSQLSVAKLMLKLVLSSSMDATLEAVRVYGNLSQSKVIRDFIMQNKVYKFVVTLLDSKSPEVCFSACGLLTNLAVDPPSKVTLTLEGAAVKLMDCLRDFGPWDWQLAGQVCKALCNLTEGSGAERLLDTQETHTLLETLETYLDKEEALQWTAEEDVRDFHKAFWESEFLPVAQKLVTRIKCQTET